MNPGLVPGSITVFKPFPVLDAFCFACFNALYNAESYSRILLHGLVENLICILGRSTK